VAGPFAYLTEDLEHPAPGCSCIVSYDMHSRTCVAILDSGADYTSIPIDLVWEFSLAQEGELEVLGVTASSEVQGLYFVNLEFAGITVACHPVLGATGQVARGIRSARKRYA
jgi:hypothetical protein